MVVVLAVVAGALIGSFLTVVIDRVPKGRSIVAPGSACGACGVRLTAVDLVPIVSWVSLRGRCRRCRIWIGFEPLIVEIAAVAVFAAFAIRYHDALWALVAHCVYGAALVAQTAIDLRTRRLPREVTYTAMALGAPLLVAASIAAGEPRRVALAAGGAVIATLLMGAIHFASRGGMGEGDVRLSPLIGMYLGWQNPGIVPLGLFLGFLAGALVGVALMAISRAGRKTALPFGPFLALGGVAAVFVGQPMVDLLLGR